MFKIQVEVNGTNIVVEAANQLNMNGLNTFIDSLIRYGVQEPTKVATKAPVKTVKRGRGRPAGAKNKRK